MCLVSSRLVIIHHLRYHLVSASLHYPSHHIVIVSRLPIEVGLRLACFTAGLNIDKEGKIGNAKHLSQLGRFPTINLYYVYLLWAKALIQIVIDLVELGHEYIAVLTVRGEVVNNQMLFVFASLLQIIERAHRRHFGIFEPIRCHLSSGDY